MVELQAQGLSLSIEGRSLIRDVSFSIRTGELVVLLGPNGAGKTTLLRGLLGLLPPASGQARLEGVPTTSLTARERALQVAYLPQLRDLAWPIRVEDLVALGRFATGATLGRLQPSDQRAVDQAIDDCDLAALRNRPVTALSGGELARAHCARAFASRTPLLLADEPTAGLDPQQQLRLLALLRRHVEEGHGALLVLHDIDLAARFADRLLWLKDGHLLADGTSAETMTSDQLAAVYGIQARVDGGRPIIEGLMNDDRPR